MYRLLENAKSHKNVIVGEEMNRNKLDKQIMNRYMFIFLYDFVVNLQWPIHGINMQMSYI